MAMRVLVLVHEYPPVGGGGGRVAQDLAERLAARGHKVTILTSAFGDLPLQETSAGVRIVRLPVGRKEAYRASLPSMGVFVLRAIVDGLRLIRRERPDVIHAHFAVPAGAGAWALSLLTSLPYVLTIHLGDVPGGAPEKTSRWFRWVFPLTPPIWKRAARVAAVSNFTRSLALRHYDVPIEVVPNGVDVAALAPAEFALHSPPQIVFAGRFVPQKNPLAIVKTLARLRDLPWHCTLLGDGALRPAVEAAVKAEGLESRFTFAGWVTPAEVLAAFDRSDILFMPSRSEGLPVVGVQALAKGLAIVAGRAGGFTDVVAEGENGYLLQPDDVEGMARRLRELIVSPERLRAMREASLRRAQLFDLNRIVSRYEALFAEVVS